jgi:long-chain acyl-CoA synthetase
MHDLNTPGILSDVAYIFRLGLSRGADRRFLGHRPVVSTNPLKFADHYEWITYAEGDARMRAIGGRLQSLFASGALKSDGLETVGIWSQNRPGTRFISCHYVFSLRCPFILRMAAV